MIRLLTFIFTLNTIFLSMDGVCLCDMNTGSSHAMIESSMSDMDETQVTVESVDCCNTSVCTDNCMSTYPLLTSNRQENIFSISAYYPEHIFSHFYKHYISVSSPPPLV